MTPASLNSFLYSSAELEDLDDSYGKIIIPQARCLRCNKPLSNPDSIAKGYGKVCLKKING